MTHPTSVPASSATAIGGEAIALARHYLSERYLPTIAGRVAPLDSEMVWRRPAEGANSIGNLLLHLAGSTRMWIVSGVAGAPDTRDRDAEFAERGPIATEELLAHLRQAVAEADGVLATLSPEELGERRQVREDEVSVLEAVLHAVEHFAMHTGQIVTLSKLAAVI